MKSNFDFVHILYFACRLENLDHMFNIGLFLNDLSLHDASRDLVLVGNHKSAELKIALDQVRFSILF